MKTLIMASLVVAMILFIVSTAQAVCPVAPVPPPGCTAICICDSTGCGFVYVCK